MSGGRRAPPEACYFGRFCHKELPPNTSMIFFHKWYIQEVLLTGHATIYSDNIAYKKCSCFLIFNKCGLKKQEHTGYTKCCNYDKVKPNNQHIIQVCLVLETATMICSCSFGANLVWLLYNFKISDLIIVDKRRWIQIYFYCYLEDLWPFNFAICSTELNRKCLPYAHKRLDR